MTLEVIHPVQLRATLGQPDQADAQLSGQVLRTVCSVAWILVQEQGDMPTPVMAVNDCQESSEVLTTLPPTCQEQPMPGGDVDRAEDDSPGIIAMIRDAMLVAVLLALNFGGIDLEAGPGDSGTDLPPASRVHDDRKPDPD